MMVMVTGVVWLREPDVPVTIRVTFDPDVGGVCELLLLQPTVKIEARSNNQIGRAHV